MNNKKVKKLKAYSNNNTLKDIRIYKRKRTIRRRLTVTLIVGLSLIVLATIPVIRNIQLADQFDQESLGLEKELETRENEKEMLEYKLSLLEDEEYVAKLARKELNLSQVNEILINLPEDEKEENSME